MQRIQYHQYGGPEVLRLEEFTPARPGAGEVLVRVRAASVNPMDFGIRSGGMKIVTGRTFPHAMGYDFSGVIEAVGEGVSRLRVGDEVLGGAAIKAAGAFADVVVTDEKRVVTKPTSLSFEHAATLPTVGVTAYQALISTGKLQRGENVFVHGCLGGVGRTAVQIALAHGATVGGSCRGTARQDALDLGVDPIVDFDVDPVPLAGRFDLVLDSAGTLPLATAKTMTTSVGRIIGIHPSPANFVRSALPGPFRTIIGQPRTKDLEEVARAAGEGSLKLPIALTVPLADAIPALTTLEVDHTPKGGKLIITPN